MQCHPIKTIPPPDEQGVVEPHQVWAYLSAQQQQQIRQVFIVIIQQFLAPLVMNAAHEEIADEH